MICSSLKRLLRTTPPLGPERAILNGEVTFPLDYFSGGRSMDISPDYVHSVVNHLENYVSGRVHTNGLENFWSLLKRGLNGTYVAVEPFHLFRYVDEQAFRYNNRATKDNPLTDADRFHLALSQIAGKRLTFAEVTGKVGETTF